MKVLILGLGQQGRAALHHLASSPEVEEIVAADSDLERAERHAAAFGGGKTRCVELDANDREALAGVLASGVDAAVCLLPTSFDDTVAQLAVQAGVHLVNSFYTTPAIRGLHERAKRNGVAVLPEMGLDPGIDLVMAAKALAAFDEVHEYISYGSGIPEPAAANNPLKYKISWTFAGVLESYVRPARLIRDGAVLDLDPAAVFDEENVHHVQVAELGELEAFANGDAVQYIDVFGLDRRKIRNMGRFTLRWPGHCVFWRKLVALGFLHGEPVRLEGREVVPKEFLRVLLEPQLQYADDERDVAFLRVVVRGIRAGAERTVVYDMIDYRDLDTGLLAMNRTVGYATAIAARKIVSGDIAARGVLSPARDVDPDMLFAELEKCAIRISPLSP